MNSFLCLMERLLRHFFLAYLLKLSLSLLNEDEIFPIQYLHVTSHYLLTTCH